MIDEHEVREMLQRRADAIPATPADTPKTVRRARRRLVLNGVVATVAAVAIIVTALAGIDAIRSAPVPADRRSGELGIFAPVAGRIFQIGGPDRGDTHGLWAVDPSAPSVSTLVRPGPEGDVPLGWSSDGTKLLFVRPEHSPYLWKDLFILQADGSEIQLNTDSRYIEGATIAPDGSRVVFAAAGGPYFPYNDVYADPGLFVVDTDGGRPVPIPYPSAGDRVYSPTFSPDGTQIAYQVLGFGDDDVDEVWVAEADGSNAHEILADEPAVAEGVSGLAWAPAGDRILMANSLGRVLEIYTFAPDGTDFTTVITGGMNPFWSPDGSQIAYMVPHDPPPGVGPPGLAIANADGSNVREFGLAASGPWHPGESEGEV